MMRHFDGVVATNKKRTYLSKKDKKKKKDVVPAAPPPPKKKLKRNIRQFLDAQKKPAPDDHPPPPQKKPAPPPPQKKKPSFPLLPPAKKPAPPVYDGEFYIGNQIPVNQIRRWFTTRDPNACLVLGQSGSGKTVLMKQLAFEFKFNSIQLFSPSDNMESKKSQKQLEEAICCSTMFGQKNLVVIENVEHFANISFILKMLKQHPKDNPILFLSDNIYNPKIKAVEKFCAGGFQLIKPTHQIMAKIAKKKLKEWNIPLPADTFHDTVARANGDVRFLLNQLTLVSASKDSTYSTDFTNIFKCTATLPKNLERAVEYHGQVPLNNLVHHNFVTEAEDMESFANSFSDMDLFSRKVPDYQPFILKDIFANQINNNNNNKLTAAPRRSQLSAKARDIIDLSCAIRGSTLLDTIDTVNIFPTDCITGTESHLFTYRDGQDYGRHQNIDPLQLRDMHRTVTQSLVINE